MRKYSDIDLLTDSADRCGRHFTKRLREIAVKGIKARLSHEQLVDAMTTGLNGLLSKEQIGIILDYARIQFSIERPMREELEDAGTASTKAADRRAKR